MNNSLFFDVASFVIVGTMIFAVFFRKTYKGYANLLFLGVLILSLLTIGCHLQISFLQKYSLHTARDRLFMHIFTYAFLMFLNFIMPLLFLYIYASMELLDIYRKNYLVRIIMEILTYFPVVYLGTNIFTKHLFIIDENLNLIYYNSIFVIPICTFCIMLLSFTTLLQYRKIISKSNFKIAIVICLINIFFLLINYKIRALELQLFLIAVTNFFISSTTQRPEIEIDSRLNCGSFFYFKNRTQKNFLLKKNDIYIFIKIVNYKNINLYIGHNNYLNFLKLLADWLTLLCKKHMLHSIPYYLENSLFVIPVEESYKDKITSVTNDLENILRESFSIDNFEFFIDPRFCVVQTPQDIDDYDYLLYFAKNFHHVLPKIKKTIYLKEFKESDDFKIKNEIENILRNALNQDNFEIFYHPIYGVQENRYVAAEALLRLKDEYFGYISPASFIPFAERNGQIHEISNIVFEKVIKFVSTEEFNKLGLDYIEINISATQCIESNLVENITGLLEKYNVTPEKIRFEITESFADFNPLVVEKNISALHNLGICFALDDYGTGYSNIKKVLSLPIDVVKLDKTFVRELENRNFKILVDDTIEMLNKLNKKVLIEGIENQSAFDYFTELKHKSAPACEYVQGYYFSRPLPQNEFVEFILKA